MPQHFLCRPEKHRHNHTDKFIYLLKAISTHLGDSTLSHKCFLFTDTLLSKVTKTYRNKTGLHFLVSSHHINVSLILFPFRTIQGKKPPLTQWWKQTISLQFKCLCLSKRPDFCFVLLTTQWSECYLHALSLYQRYFCWSWLCKWGASLSVCRLQTSQNHFLHCKVTGKKDRGESLLFSDLICYLYSLLALFEWI